MKLEKLILKNFLTYEDLEYDFINRPLLIQGRNLTDEGQLSNGSGKSGLQTGIEFCITASNSRGVRDNELISFGQKEANADLIVSCDVRKERIHISWLLKIKGSNQLTITRQGFKGNWEEVSFSNVNDGKRWIMNWFDISKEDLFNYFLINKSRFKSFFESSNKEKVDLINRFSDASIIEGLEDVDTSILQSKFNQLEREEIQTDTRIEVKKEALHLEKERDLKEEFEEQVEDINCDIDKLTAKRVRIEGDIKDSQELCKDLNLHNEEIRKDLKDDEKTLSLMIRDIDEHQEKSKSIEESLVEAQKLVDDFKGLDHLEKKEQLRDAIEEDDYEIDSLRDSIISYEDKRDQLLTFIQDIDIKLSGTITCPSCTHEFILDGDIETLNSNKVKANGIMKRALEKIASQQAAQKILNEQVECFYNTIKELKLDEEKSLEGKSTFLRSLNEIRKNLSNHETVSRRLKKEYDREIDDQKSLEDNILENNTKERLEKIKIKSNEDLIKRGYSEIDSLKREIKSLKPGSNLSDISLLEEDIKALQLSNDTIRCNRVEVGDEIYKLNQWKNNFKQFRLHLANQSLEVIEYHSNRYLTEMGSDLKVKLEGYKVLASGAIKDEITAVIIRNVERTYSSFSGGEKGRLLFASILANRYMINKTHQYGGLDFLSIDEIFEGVDSIGLKSLINSAKQLGIAVMIITHVTDENVSDDILVIEKVNGVSNIIKN